MDTPDPTTTLPTSPRPPFDGRRLRRRPDDGPVAGLCAGIADYLAVDVAVVRLATVLLAVLGPGLPAYLVGWVVVPAAGPGDPPARASGSAPGRGVGERGPGLLGAALLVLAAILVWNRLDWPGGGLLLPVTLIGAGVVLLARAADDDEGDDGGPPRTTAVVPTTAPPPPAPTTASERVEALPSPPRPPRSAVGPVFLGLALVWAGVAVLVDVSAETGLAVALGVLGLGLVVSAFAGRARWLAGPGLLVAAALLMTSAIHVPIRGGVGERAWRVDAVADVDGPFRLAMGEGVLDLRALRPGVERTVSIEASVAMGRLLVLLPEDVDVVIEADVDAGEVVVLGVADNGTDVHVEERVEGTGRTPGRIALDLGVGFGQVEVIR